MSPNKFHQSNKSNILQILFGMVEQLYNILRTIVIQLLRTVFATEYGSGSLNGPTKLHNETASKEIKFDHRHDRRMLLLP